LHAREIAFIHPVKQERIHVIAPVPDLMEWKGAEEEGEG
jgi:hypothetical protein